MADGEISPAMAEAGALRLAEIGEASATYVVTEVFRAMMDSMRPQEIPAGTKAVYETVNNPDGSTTITAHYLLFPDGSRRTLSHRPRHDAD